MRYNENNHTVGELTRTRVKFLWHLVNVMMTLFEDLLHCTKRPGRGGAQEKLGAVIAAGISSSIESWLWAPLVLGAMARDPG